MTPIEKGNVMRTIAMSVALLALTGLARADDDDPEPPRGAAFRKLQGTWTSVRIIMKGEEVARTTISYKFTKDKVVYTLTKGKTKDMTLKVDRKRHDLIEMSPDQGKTLRFFFKIEKGELYLTPAPSDDPKVKPDFSGKAGSVLILKQEKQ